METPRAKIQVLVKIIQGISNLANIFFIVIVFVFRAT